jgi:hypothetical protein
MALDRAVDMLRFRRKQNFVDLADRARDAGQWELAVQLYRKALDRNPKEGGDVPTRSSSTSRAQRPRSATTPV